MRRAPRRHRGEGGRRRSEGASCEDSDLGSVRRQSDCWWTFGLIIFNPSAPVTVVRVHVRMTSEILALLFAGEDAVFVVGTRR
ncbi:jg27931 [Pararge aegeria aegeria]|uniref:Jg27931 protein n=1 Tax=Pararge aegeria aegeria TaxID=348720 RepID=A0A8S4R1T0_9NEOP|nr:jg27931 [Pararge aegeria aegeria]